MYPDDNAVATAGGQVPGTHQGRCAILSTPRLNFPEVVDYLTQFGRTAETWRTVDFTQVISSHNDPQFDVGRKPRQRRRQILDRFAHGLRAIENQHDALRWCGQAFGNGLFYD